MMPLSMQQLKTQLLARQRAQAAGNHDEVKRIESELAAQGIVKIVDYIGTIGVYVKANALADGWPHDHFEILSANLLEAT